MASVYGIVIILIGLFLLIKPDVIWKIQRALYVRDEDAQPTKFWQILARCSGVLAVVIGVIVTLFA